MFFNLSVESTSCSFSIPVEIGVENNQQFSYIIHDYFA